MCSSIALFSLDLKVASIKHALFLNGFLQYDAKIKHRDLSPGPVEEVFTINL